MEWEGCRKRKGSRGRGGKRREGKEREGKEEKGNGPKPTHPFKNADFHPIFVRIASAVTSSEKSSIKTNRKSSFPMSWRWTVYVDGYKSLPLRQRCKVAVFHLNNRIIICDNFDTVGDRGRVCNSSCSLDRSTLYGAILNATLWTTGSLQFFWIGLKRRSTRASHVTKMAREAEVPFTL